MCVEWGLKKADELRFESYVEAGMMAKRIYEGHGFVHVDTVSLRFEKPNAAPSEEWRRCMEKLTAMPTAIMWRPVGGKYEKGKTVIPWEAKPREHFLYT